MAATLRPETMYGQTNCWALPEGDYGAFQGCDSEIYIMSARCGLRQYFHDIIRPPSASILFEPSTD